ncbi:alcohol dehydrogenase superfamily protein [Mycena olivaceomarginata]|nr:alcohol dehydrogenase superfamily protein [Mycena olivaceomarginata]
MSIPTKTRQYRYSELGSYDNLVLEEVPLPKLKGNEVLVKTHAVYRDLLIATKQYPSKVLPNLVPCSDMAGEVIAVGEDLNHVQTPETDGSALGGAVQGVLTEYRAFPAHVVARDHSPHLSYEEASTLPCAAGGDTVLIQGTGGVSIFALQFAVASGATVIAISSSDEKLKVVKDLGAAHVINYKTTPDWDKEALKLTGGIGVDRVIEVAGNATLGRSIGAVRLGGSIDIIGLVGGPNDTGPVDIVVPTIFRSLQIRGLYVGSVPQFHDMVKLITANPKTTRPVVDRVFPFEEAKDAFAYLTSQAHVGKIVIKL